MTDPTPPESPLASAERLLAEALHIPEWPCDHGQYDPPQCVRAAQSILLAHPALADTLLRGLGAEGYEKALRRLASWDEMAGHGDPDEFPEMYRAEVRDRINHARTALQQPARPGPTEWETASPELRDSWLYRHEGRGSRPAPATQEDRS